MATIVKSASGLEFRLSVPVPVSGGTAVPATGTNRYVITLLDRRVRFREFGIVAQQTITTGFPATNNMVAKLYNVTKATQIAQGTVVGLGASPGTRNLNRATYTQLATLRKFKSGYSVASAQDVLSIHFTSKVTLNRGLTRPIAILLGDLID